MQQAIKSARYCFYNNRVSELAVRNPKKWWKQVKSLTGQGISAKQKWYYQFLSDTTLDDSNLATEINNFFSNITKHFEPLASVQTPTPPSLPPPPPPPLVSLEEVLSDLQKLAICKAVGPDGICNELLKLRSPRLSLRPLYATFTISHCEKDLFPTL